MTELPGGATRTFALRMVLPWLGGWIAVLGGVVAAALSLAPYVAPGIWIVDNLSFFPRQFLACAAAALVTALIAARWPHRRPWRFRTAIILLAVLLATGTVMAFGKVASVAGSGGAIAGGKPLRIASINLETLFLGSERLLALLEDTQPDVLVLQETAWPWQIEEWQQRHGVDKIAGNGPYPAHVATGGLGDVVVFSRYPIRSMAAVEPAIPAPHRRVGIREFLDLELDVDGSPLRLIAVHPASPRSAGRWRARQAYFKALDARLGWSVQPGEVPLIIIGDWNLSPWSVHFSRFLGRHALRTAFPDSFPQTTRFFFDYRLSRIFGAVVDHVAASSEIVFGAVAIGPDIGSDHLPLVVDITLP